MRKAAGELTGTPPPPKGISMSERKSTRGRRNKKVNRGVSKIVCLSKCKAPALQEDCVSNPLEIIQSLQALARDPLNKRGRTYPSGTVATLFRFWARMADKRFGQTYEQSFVGEADNGAQGVSECAQLVYGEDPRKDNKENLEIDQVGEATKNLPKHGHVPCEEDDACVEGGQCSETSTDNLLKEAQILFAGERDGYKAILDNHQSSESSEDSPDGDNPLCKTERLGMGQTAQRRRLDAREETLSKSSKQCPSPISMGKLELMPVIQREPAIEPKFLKVNQEPMLALPAPISTSSSTPSYTSVASEMKLGLSMIFSKHSDMPSVSELKTMFMQFGPLQPSGVRVFKQSASAQVVFISAQDAKAALKHVKRNAMFGLAAVSYTLHKFRLSDLRKKVPAFSRDSSSRAHAGGGELTYRNLHRSSELARSLKERASEHLRAATATLESNGHVNRALLGQPARNVDRSRTNPILNSIEGLVEERMQTLLQGLNLIVGHATSETK